MATHTDLFCLGGRSWSGIGLDVEVAYRWEGSRWRVGCWGFSGGDFCGGGGLDVFLWMVLWGREKKVRRKE